MEVLVILIPVSLLLGGLGLAAFLWSLRHGQYGDLEGDGMRILTGEHDDAPAADEEATGD